MLAMAPERMPCIYWYADIRQAENEEGERIACLGGAQSADGSDSQQMCSKVCPSSVKCHPSALFVEFTFS